MSTELRVEQSRIEPGATAPLDAARCVARLRRFLSPQVAQVALARDGWRLLERHRAKVAVIFCDLRGFTAFSERVGCEQTDRCLIEYHACLERLLQDYDATLDHRAGDGVMAFIGDPVPVHPADAAISRAVALALDLREIVSALLWRWRYPNAALGIGVGLNFGECTVGLLGSRWRSDYSATGRPVNLAARLCALAAHGQILLPRRVAWSVRDEVELEPLPAVTVKGIDAPLHVVNVLGRIAESRASAARAPQADRGIAREGSCRR